MLSLFLKLKEPIKSFKRDKAPGPDGWPVEFYLTFFDLLGPLLVKMVDTSRVLGRVTPAINSNFLTLIPKVDRPVTFVYFPPLLILKKGSPSRVKSP